MPLSIAALVSGMMTLVATAPNLIVHAELVRSGYEGFGFFAFTPFGLPVLALAIAYVRLVRRRLAPGRVAGEPPVDPARSHMAEWIEEYALAGREFRLRVGASSALAGQRLQALDLRASEGVNVLAIERQERFGKRLLVPTAGTLLAAGDVLFLDVADPARDLDALARRFDLASLPLAG